MNYKIVNTVALAALTLFLVSCGNTSQKSADGHQEEKTESPESGHQEETEAKSVHLSERAFKSLEMKVDTLPTRMITGVIEANGQLEVPPQYEATVTAIVGANVTAIKVIEGDKVSKGEVLAYLAHPNLIKLQTNYVQAYNQLQFLEKEMQRQKRLYEAEVGSGKVYQKTKAEYQAKKALVTGLEAQLEQLGLNVSRIRQGNLYQNVPVVSPINGYVEKVAVEIGEYVPPQKALFKIINTEHVHADLMVFEKDVHKVKEGQTVYFTTESMPGKRLKAKIFAVGEKFEQDPRAVHIHAEIENKNGRLIPGMYIHGKIQTGGKKVKALPSEAIISENGKPHIFTAKLHKENGEKEWEFSMLEVRTGKTVDGWTEIKLLQPLPDSTLVAWNNAYYLISEMKKGSTGHGH